jgi:hypothetical protein
MASLGHDGIPAAHPSLSHPGRRRLPATRCPPRPVPAASARRAHIVQRRLSSRGGLMVARQKIHAGKIATVIC